MKKIIIKTIYLCAIIMSVTSLYAQSYIPLLQQNNQWNILRRDANPNLYYTEIYKIDLDTIINGYLCKKVIKTNDSSSSAAFSFAYYMYEDTLEKKIYTLDNNFNKKLYFNFNVHIGDTLILYSPYYNLNYCDTFYVSQIDIENIGGLNRKKISTNFKLGVTLINAEVWIEGIGTYKGLPYSGFPPITGPLFNLLCFRNNNQLIYYNTNYNYCYANNIGINDFENPKISVYPNPITDNLFIENILNKDSQLQIFDVYGRLVFNQNLIEQNNTISVSNLKRGIYYVEIYNKNNKVFTKKISKI